MNNIGNEMLIVSGGPRALRKYEQRPKTIQDNPQEY